VSYLTKSLPVMAAVGSAVLLVGLALFPQQGTAADNELHALTWEGYTDPSVISIFEEQTGCTLIPTYVGDNDEITAKMAAGGGEYDVISPAVDNAQLMIGMDVLEPLDPARLEHFDEIYQSFRDQPGVQSDGQIWSMPMAWGSIPLMYRTDKFDEPPTSATVLWDPQYAGKIAIQNVKSSMYIAARVLYGPDFDVYDMTDEQLDAVKAKLLEQKPLVRKYWSSAGELIELYANDEVWVSETWGGYQVAQLQEMGIPVAEVLPIEKADGWQDVWNIVKGTENLDCAYAWINFISGPDGQCGMVRVAGYSAANPSAVQECLTDDVKRELHLDNLDYAEGLDFWKLPPRIGKYVEVWNAVLAAP
jgi:spermidine/putrescine transport system substrate-binding protein